ncbi:hypothetical protein M8J77_009180 [Diaphorina citri]|nr:hypothetical protein M8J77_009180 [Diaphorina citri]
MTDMDHQQLMDLIAREIDRRTSQLMNENIRLQQQCETEKVLKQQVINIPCPSPLDLSGNVRDNIQFFTRMWKEYLVASGTEKEPEKKKVALLMNVIGCEAAKIVFKIVNIEEEGITTDKVLEALKKKMSPEINVRYERFVFNSMKQEEEEDYQTYFMRLNDQIKLCEYKAMEEEIMIDKIICSIKNMKMKEKLWLRENLKLTDVVQMCKADEESKKQLENMSGKANDINKIKSTTLPASATSKKCPYCGGQWHSSLLKCPAKNKTCFKCNKKGHFSHVCRGEAVLKEVTRASASENDNDVLKIEKSGTNGVYSNLNFVLGNSKVKSVRCQLDTGASCNVIGHNQLKQILGKGECALLDNTSVKLRAFGGTPIAVLGAFTLKVRRYKTLYNISFIVVDKDHCPLLSAETCETLKLIKYCNEINSEFQLERQDVHSDPIINEFMDVFDGIGRMKGDVDIEIINGRTPVRQPPRRIPISMREDLKKELEDMERMGIIKKETEYTDWVSNLTIVRKDNKQLRICLDPRFLNEAIKDTKQQLPTLDEVLPELNNAKVFSTVDARKGFWQVVLSEESSKLTAFWTPYGKYRYLRLPFGISTAMEIFQQKMLEVTAGLSGIYVLADDILIVGRGNTDSEAQENHDRNLRALLFRLREENVRLNIEKLKLKQREIVFFGHRLSSEGVRPDNKKVSAITEMPKPENKEAVLRFLGMVTYLSRYIPNLSTHAEPLRELTRLSSEFIWGAKHDSAFSKLKTIIGQSSNLKYFDVNSEIYIQTDASGFALGCALMQNGFPIAYASKTLSSTQRNYAQIEKEMLAIVFACKKFDQYICGKKVIIETDHSPLVSVFKKSLLKTPKRLQSMILSLQRYNLLIKYKRGKEMYLADTLSRAPISMENDEKQLDVYELDSYDQISTVNELQQGIQYLEDRKASISDKSLEKLKIETRKDSQLQRLHQQILNGWPENKQNVDNSLKCFWNFRSDLVIEDDFILKGNQIIVPKCLRKEFLDKLHSGHLGVEATLKLARETLFWPGITEQVRNKVLSCETCARFAPNQAKIQMMSHIIPESPFEVVSMDVFEVTINNRKRRFLVTVDHYSDFFEIDELPDMTARSLIVICKRNFSRYGIPSLVISDNGSNFVNREFAAFTEEWEFSHKTSSPFHQQGNGKAEAAVKIVKQLIQKAIAENVDFYKMLLVWRNTPNKVNFSPARRFMCRWLRCQVPNIQKYQQIVSSETIQKNIQHNRIAAGKQYNKHTVQRKPLAVYQPIWYKKNPSDKEWQKGTIIEKENNREYHIKTENDNVIRRNEIHIKPRICGLQEENIEEKLDDSSQEEYFEAEDQEGQGVSQEDEEMEEQRIEDETDQEDGNEEDQEDGNEEIEDERETKMEEEVYVRPKRIIKQPKKFDDYVMYK